MELVKFLKLLYRHRYLLVFIPLLTIIVTYFLVRRLPDTFISRGQVSTGIVDETQMSNDASITKLQESQINQEFGNLVEMMHMKIMLDQISYKLILHDLTSPRPFRKESKDLQYLNQSARKHLISVVTDKYNKRQGLDLWNKDQNGIHRVIRSMEYDEQSIRKQLGVYRSGTSDFINVEYTSENPELSAYIVNTLCNEFITYYTYLTRFNHNKSVNFLNKLLADKYQAMNQKIAELKDYKIKNRVLNLNEQSKILYTQIMDFESRKVQAQKDVIATTGALNNIDSRFDPKDRQYLESTMTKVNQEILASKDELRSLSDRYIQSNFNPRIRTSIDSLQGILNAQINSLTDKYIYNPLNAKQNLIEQKLVLQVQLDLAKNSVKTLNDELVNLNSRFDQLVPNEAVVQTFERDIDIASREYLEILNKYNQASMESSYSVKLKQVQSAMPETAQPSKKLLLVILSGIISLVFCIFVFFIVYFLDTTIHTSQELADKSGSPVLGQLNFLSGEHIDFKSIWTSKVLSPELQTFKAQIRSARYELNKELVNSKALSVTSLSAREGKTFAALSLAYAYLSTSKKVLVIDGNFIDPAITHISKRDYFIEDYLSGQQPLPEIKQGDIQVIGNRGGDNSLFEIADQALIEKKMDQLKEVYDMIIIETASMSSLEKAQEWFPFTDKLLAIFQASQKMDIRKIEHISYLKNTEDKFAGFLLNKVPDKPNG